MGKIIKHAIAYVIYNSDRSRFLIVQRPSDDEDLPNAWGLPAGSIRGEESFERAVIRSGREKLGVELKVVEQIGEGSLERTSHRLHMKEYEAEIVSGTPKVPQPVKGVTQYQALRWGAKEDLRDAASKGSLCCRLYLENH